MPAFTDVWNAFTWTLFGWLSSPKLVVPIILSMTLLVWLIRLPARIKPVRPTLSILLISYLMLATPPVASLLIGGLTLPLPRTDQPVDAAVVLSRGNYVSRSPYILAVDLWRAHQTAKIFVTGEGRAGFMARYLQRHQLPAGILDGTACYRTTYEEASSAAAILRPQAVRRILVITDPPHLLRSVLTFRALGFEAFPKAVPLRSDLPALQRSFLALREYLGLVSYAALGRLSKATTNRVTTQAWLTSRLSECTIEWLRREKE